MLSLHDKLYSDGHEKAVNTFNMNTRKISGDHSIKDSFLLPVIDPMTSTNILINTRKVPYHFSINRSIMAILSTIDWYASTVKANEALKRLNIKQFLNDESTLLMTSGVSVIRVNKHNKSRVNLRVINIKHFDLIDDMYGDKIIRLYSKITNNIYRIVECYNQYDYNDNKVPYEKEYFVKVDKNIVNKVLTNYEVEKYYSKFVQAEYDFSDANEIYCNTYESNYFSYIFYHNQVTDIDKFGMSAVDMWDSAINTLMLTERCLLEAAVLNRSYRIVGPENITNKNPDTGESVLDNSGAFTFPMSADRNYQYAILKPDIDTSKIIDSNQQCFGLLSVATGLHSMLLGDTSKISSNLSGESINAMLASTNLYVGYLGIPMSLLFEKIIEDVFNIYNFNIKYDVTIINIDKGIEDDNKQDVEIEQDVENTDDIDNKNVDSTKDGKDLKIDNNDDNDDNDDINSTGGYDNRDEDKKNGFFENQMLPVKNVRLNEE